MKKIYLISALICSFVSCNALADWPPEAGAKVSGNTPELPTTLKPVNKSLSDLLNNGGVIISSQLSEHGPIVTLKNGKKYVFCAVTGAGDGNDQNVSTSRCYSMN